MDKIFGVILITALAGIVGTGLGGILTFTVKRDSSKIVGILMAFASGITLGTVCFHFISEAIHSGEGHDHASILTVTLGISIGYVAVLLLDNLITKRLHKGHHDHSHFECDCCDNDTHKLTVAGAIMAFSVALHNLPVGMVIGASSLSGAGFIPSATLTTALAIAMHNIPEGMTVTVPFLTSGMKKSKALAITSLCGITTVIGGVIGYTVGTFSPLTLTVVLSLAAGAMLYVTFSELIPEAIAHCHPRVASVAMLAGMIVSMLIAFSGGHGHT